MVNTQLFKTTPGKLPPAADAVNQSGARAYGYKTRHRLAQLAATGCMTSTFYAGAQSQLEDALALAQDVDTAFLAKTAVYARQSGHMKDMPALLAAVLAQRDIALLQPVFGRVVDNGKMLRNFVQILRSGQTGRKSLGSRPKKLVQQWLVTASEQRLLQASIGTEPTLADVVRMAHPKPAEAWRAAWFAWLIDRPYDEAALPPATLAYERFKRALLSGKTEGATADDLPPVPFQMLTALPLNDSHWARIAAQGSWQMVRQNLNAFARHGVFERPGMTAQLAALLRDPKAVASARVLPYQLMTAFNAASDVPSQIRDALQDAMEAALVNVPAVEGRVVVCPDVSGSMSSAVTGGRGSATSVVRCIDVAALVAAALVRKNPDCRVMPFECDVVSVKLNPRDSVMTNAAKLAAVGGGGTSVSAPLRLLNKEQALVDLVVIVSDNESWIDARRHGATETMTQWEAIKARCPTAKLVCIDIQPGASTQAVERQDVMNVGGFSDAVFRMVGEFAGGATEVGHWVREIERVSLDPQ
ncbi:vWA domain-containing protein [Roseateles chitinivorans]|uniref:vWA domain-containing protein n=1 Tax=Roseateles chitinivorans TaxID=2917965 RepID=UPI003D66CDC0